MLNRRATRMYKARMIPFKRLNEIRTRKRAESANDGNRISTNEMTSSNMTEVVRKEPKMADEQVTRPVTQAQYSPRIQTIKRNPSVGEHSSGMTHTGIPVNHHSPTHIRSTTMTPTNQPPQGAAMKPPQKMSQDGRNYVNVGAPISIGIPPSGNLSHQASDQPKMTPKQNWIMKQKTPTQSHPQGPHSGHGGPSGGQQGPPKSTVLHVQRRESVQSPRKSSNHPQNSQSIKVQVPKSAYIIQNKHISSTKNEKGRLVLQSTGTTGHHGQAFGGKQTVMLQTPNKQITTNTIRFV